MPLGKCGDRVIDLEFWRNKKVFITGHTGFKGSWLCLWLHLMGAKITGFSLGPPTNPNMFQLCKINEIVHSYEGDIRDKDLLIQAMEESAPDIVIHMAAQPIVRDSYKNPVDTFHINVLGTVHLLEAVRALAEAGSPVEAVLNVTTDKCYHNFEWPWGYRENDRLGGFDPYSNSKACSELVTESYRSSFFPPDEYGRHKTAIASARAGNVIGGGDWARDRLIPDCIRSVLKGEKIKIRFPKAVRPWQHVLEPLHGYLILLEKLAKKGPDYGEAWNFGPNDHDIKTVEWIVGRFCEKWGKGAAYEIDNNGHHPVEANYLKLDCAKAKQRLNWRPVWDLDTAIDKIIEWTRAYAGGQVDLREASLRQIKDFMEDVNKNEHTAP